MPLLDIGPAVRYNGRRAALSDEEVDVSKVLKLGFIGLGSRNRVYARNLLRQFKDKICISAVCDVSSERRREFKTSFGSEETLEYADHETLARRHGDLDGVLIATPNNAHDEVAATFLRAGKSILLEKPIAHSVTACRNIARAYDASTSKVTMGFVLRYTPFYKTIAELVRAGKIGTIKILKADEVVGPLLGSLFFRTWRGKTEHTGGLLLEKCCHDLDLINNILNRDPVRVSAFAVSGGYAARETYGPRCATCVHRDECPYSTVLWSKQIDKTEDNGEYEYVDFEDDTCIYNNDHDVVDHQSQLIEYEGGILVYFNVTLGGMDTRRTIDIIGSEGRITGDFSENRILLYQMNRSAPQAIPIEHERSGHGGGDSVITRSFMDSIENPQFIPEASVKDALKSAYLAFLCDRARDEGKALAVDYLEELASLRS